MVQWELMLLKRVDVPSDFSCPPWSEAVLVTPRHAVRMKWNAITALGLTHIICLAFKIAQGRLLEEKVVLATKPKRG